MVIENQVKDTKFAQKQLKKRDFLACDSIPQAPSRPLFVPSIVGSIPPRYLSIYRASHFRKNQQRKKAHNLSFSSSI